MAEIVMTARQLMRAADALTGVHPGMTSEEVREALHRWHPGVDRGYAKKPEFGPAKSGTSTAEKRYIGKPRLTPEERRQATRERVRAYRARRAAPGCPTINDLLPGDR